MEIVRYIWYEIVYSESRYRESRIDDLVRHIGPSIFDIEIAIEDIDIVSIAISIDIERVNPSRICHWCNIVEQSSLSTTRRHHIDTLIARSISISERATRRWSTGSSSCDHTRELAQESRSRLIESPLLSCLTSSWSRSCGSLIVVELCEETSRSGRCRCSICDELSR